MNAPTRPIIIGGNPDPVTDEVNSAKAIRLAGWWQRANLIEHYPITNAEAARLLRFGGEYAVDAASLAVLVARGLIQRPGVGETGSLEWSAMDVLMASGSLDARGQFIPTPSAHDHRKSPSQLALESARLEGCLSEIFHETPRLDVTHLLTMLVELNSKERRQKIISVLKATLELEHGIIIP